MSPFASTRGHRGASAADAVLTGLAPDSGLYVPEDPPSLPRPPRDIGTWSDAARWASPFLLPEVDEETVDLVVREALSFPLPMRELEPGLHVLELFHGPTHAFKDVGARFLARLARAFRGTETDSVSRTVLVATSGDTGGAVVDAFHDVPGFRVVALFPRAGVSARQRRQMTTLGGNAIAVAVDGTFDDCQRMVKEAFADPALAERHGLLSANSINVGRLLPQALYYVYAAAMLGWDARPARFVVPCGNLGNLCSGLLAHRSGMPAAGFVAATNANRAFVDYLARGAVEPKPTIPTISSAMDVGVPSNLERIRWLYRDDPGALTSDVAGVSVSDEETRRCIRDVHERTGYVMDPHTAVAYRAALRHREGASAPLVVLATAHPAKFPEVTEALIGREVPLPEGLARGMDREESMTEIGPSAGALAALLDEDRR